MSKQPKYNIYPSALNSFQRLLDVEREFEDFFNVDSEGEYKRSLEEITEEREKELLDLINRVPKEPIEAADKGTAFNEIVDSLVQCCKCENKSLTLTAMDNESGIRLVRAEIDGFKFDFDLLFCDAVAAYFANSTCQHRCEAIINTRYGDVLLYGYPDYIRYNKVYDLKTTSSYGWGKFSDNWQRHLYPYCLLESGEMQDIDEFEFTVYQWKGGGVKDPVIKANQYKECYTYNHEASTEALKKICERFIEWLEAHKELITDKKIFNYDN